MYFLLKWRAHTQYLEEYRALLTWWTVHTARLEDYRVLTSWLTTRTQWLEVYRALCRGTQPILSGWKNIMFVFVVESPYSGVVRLSCFANVVRRLSCFDVMFDARSLHVLLRDCLQDPRDEL